MADNSIMYDALRDASDGDVACLVVYAYPHLHKYLDQLRLLHTFTVEAEVK
jgi:hypothetical protein